LTEGPVVPAACPMERSADELHGHSRATERQTGMRSGWSVCGPKRPP